MMSRAAFVHLHLHTNYSLLDGACRITPLVKRAAELSFPALAMTDHGNIFGAVEFYEACMKAGIKPIIGVPLTGSALNGMDALYATVQMPKGVPVATVAIDGAANAAFLAVEILALQDASLRSRLVAFRQAERAKLESTLPGSHP